MISIYDFYFSNVTSEIIWLNTFQEFFSYSHMTSKLGILSNHAEYLKRLALFVIRTTLFYNFKISLSNKSISLFGEK